MNGGGGIAGHCYCSESLGLCDLGVNLGGGDGFERKWMRELTGCVDGSGECDSLNWVVYDFVQVHEHGSGKTY